MRPLAYAFANWIFLFCTGSLYSNNYKNIVPFEELTGVQMPIINFSDENLIRMISREKFHVTNVSLDFSTGVYFA